jgi:hypothetical protein
LIRVTQTCNPPSISTQPAAQNINAGQTATVVVRATGTSLRYQWYQGSSGDVSLPIAGANSSSFTTPALTRTTNYWVRLSNECGTVDSATVAIAVTPILDAIDPACDSPDNCPGSYLSERAGLSDEVGLSPDTGRLAAAGVKRDGAVTDGVTMLLLRTPSEGPVTFTIKTPDGAPATDDTWGLLMSRDGSSRGTSVTIESDATLKRAFAAYRTPPDFPGSSDSNAEQITIEATTGAGSVSTKLKLVRPPLVLVHGVWSNGKAWKSLEGYLKGRGFTVCGGCRVDYGRKQPAGSFDPTETDRENQYVVRALDEATNEARRSLRTGDNVAVTQVDVVGHSMGGLVARARVVASYLKRATFIKLSR